MPIMNEEFYLQLAKDVGETKANTESLIRLHDTLVSRVNDHERYISNAKTRWAWLSGVAAVVSLLGSLGGTYLQVFIRKHV